MEIDSSSKYTTVKTETLEVLNSSLEKKISGKRNLAPLKNINKNI